LPFLFGVRMVCEWCANIQRKIQVEIDFNMEMAINFTCAA